MKLIHVLENKMPIPKSAVTDPEKAYRYACDLNERIPELEPLIMKHPVWACWYANDIIQGRWPEAEPVIMTAPMEVCKHYIKSIINGRWPEAEHIIMKNASFANWYLRNFPETRTPSKDIPLVLGYYAITDVPNTITDEQVDQLLKIIEPKANILWAFNTDRMYFEPLIKEELTNNKLKKVTTKQLLDNKELRNTFIKHLDRYMVYVNSDFE